MFRLKQSLTYPSAPLLTMECPSTLHSGGTSIISSVFVIYFPSYPIAHAWLVLPCKVTIVSWEYLQYSPFGMLYQMTTHSYLLYWYTTVVILLIFCCRASIFLIYIPTLRGCYNYRWFDDEPIRLFIPEKLFYHE